MHTRRILQMRPPLSCSYVMFPRSSAVSSQPACLQQLRLNMSHWFSVSDCFIFLHTESNADSRIMLLKMSTAAGPFLIGSSPHSSYQQKQCYGRRNACAFVDSQHTVCVYCQQSRIRGSLKCFKGQAASKLYVEWVSEWDAHIQYICRVCMCIFLCICMCIYRSAQLWKAVSITPLLWAADYHTPSCARGLRPEHIEQRGQPCTAK